MTKSIFTYKAQSIGDKKVEDIIILLTNEMPEFKTVEKSNRLFEMEASELAEVLCNTLPGGTLDRLIAKLLMKKASSFVVPLFDKDKEAA